MRKPVQIAIVGPECSGKTTLAGQLAKHFDSPAVPEVAREYLAEIKRSYKREDLINIAEQQLKLSAEMDRASGSDYLFHDTEMLTIKIWEEEKWGRVSDFIEEKWQDQEMDLYLLCKPDLPWVDDGLRENPMDRTRLFNIYYSRLETAGCRKEIVQGLGEKRFQMAISAVNAL